MPKPKSKVLNLVQADKVTPVRRTGRDALRILIVNYEYPPMGGGAANATANTARELAAMGHQVHVLTSRLHGQLVTENIDGVNVVRAVSVRRSIHECGLLGALTFIVAAALKLRGLCRNNEFDICHYYFGLPTGLLSIYTGWILNIPYVVSLRGSDVPGYDATRASLKPLHGVLKPLLRQIWRRAAAVVALSGGLKRLARETAPQQAIDVVGNAIASDQFPAARRSFQREPLRLICVCRLVRRKGLAHLLEAMQTLGRSGHRLELVGSGELMKDVRERIHELGIGNYVHLPGYVPRERLADYYNDADLFVLPSLSESFGQVLLEAMSCGLPIVATRVGGIPETITHGDNGLLVKPGDAGELVVAVQALADDPAKRRRMAEHNASLARTVYRWETVAARYEDIYVKAIGERRSAAT